jgi:hypothetical protein
MLQQAQGNNTKAVSAEKTVIHSEESITADISISTRQK